jgi:hypothetical protein
MRQLRAIDCTHGGQLQTLSVLSCASVVITAVALAASSSYLGVCACALFVLAAASTRATANT